LGGHPLEGGPNFWNRLIVVLRTDPYKVGGGKSLDKHWCAGIYRRNTKSTLLTAGHKGYNTQFTTMLLSIQELLNNNIVVRNGIYTFRAPAQ